MKSLTVKFGAAIAVMLLSLSLTSCSPYASVGVNTGYGRPYGGYYGNPYRYGYRQPVIIARPPIVVTPRRYYAPSRPYSSRRSYGTRAYGSGYRNNYGRRR